MNLPRKAKTKTDKLTRQVFIALKYFLDWDFSCSDLMSYFDISKYTLRRDLIELNMCIAFNGDFLDYLEISIPEKHSTIASNQAQAHTNRLWRILSMEHDYYPGILNYCNCDSEKIYKESIFDCEESEYHELHPNAWYTDNITASEKRKIQRDYKVLITAAGMLRSYDDITCRGRTNYWN